MIKTFLQRWWILNRLYHFGLIGDRPLEKVWLGRDEFITYINNSWITNCIIPKQLGDHKKRNLIEQLAEEKVGLIRKYVGKQNPIEYIALTAKGLEQYSVSYLVYITLEYNYLKRIVEWSIPVGAIYIVSRFFHITITGN